MMIFLAIWQWQRPALKYLKTIQALNLQLSSENSLLKLFSSTSMISDF